MFYLRFESDYRFTDVKRNFTSNCIIASFSSTTNKYHGHCKIANIARGKGVGLLEIGVHSMSFNA
jgi:hypothetical protein